MGVLIRCALASFFAVAVAACSPEIGRGTYFCGPERLCPPGQACNDNTFTCESPNLIEPFSCPDESELFEPDDIPGQAHDLGRLACGMAAIEGSPGCIPDINDADYIVFEHQSDCTGSDPHLSITLRYPIALVPLRVELLDSEERVVAEAEICTPSGDLTGTEKLCLEADPPPGTYLVRITSEEDRPDCDGACHYNQYVLDVRFPLS